MFVDCCLGELPHPAGAYLLVVPVFSIRHARRLAASRLSSVCLAGKTITALRTPPLSLRATQEYVTVAYSRPHYENDHAAALRMM